MWHVRSENEAPVARERTTKVRRIRDERKRVRCGEKCRGSGEDIDISKAWG